MTSQQRGTIGLMMLMVAAWSVGAHAEDGATSRPTDVMVTTTQRAVDPAVERILEQLEKAGKQIKDVSAKLTFIKTDPILEDVQKYQGVIRYKDTKPNPRFFIRFDTFTQEGILRDVKQWHLFDGRWYIEAREQTKTIVRREILRPGESRDIFAIGQGPFPLPFGQKKEEILNHFVCRKVDATPKDPPHSDHIACTPLPFTDLADKYATVHFYIDRKLNLPVKVETIEKQEGLEIVAILDEVKINTGLADSDLGLPELSDYAVTEEKLGPLSPAATENE